MTEINKLQVWFITGSQDLYGPETLAQAAKHAEEIANYFNDSQTIPVEVIYKPIVKNTDEIYETILAANTAKNCIGIITWMHTFSPAKMWIRGLNILNKPLLHLHTQYNRDIPWSTMDMDFMNLNQSAHGDREFGFIVSRLRINRKVVTGHWQDEEVSQKINVWARAAAAWHDWQGAKFVRFGDNMRYVAVTDGDKVEAESKFGFSVNTYAVGDLVEVINDATDQEVSALLKEYEETYILADDVKEGGVNRQNIVDAAKIEVGLSKFLASGGYKGFTDTFEDLHGLAQLPGLAVQRLMEKGYGFAGEGDWKTPALVRACKVMAQGLEGGNAFMEDYTYHFDPNNSMVLGSHMLEVDPSLSAEKPRLEVHPLGIGGKADPARLVFNVGAGPALNASLIDMGNRFRLVVNTVEAVDVVENLPKLPVARVLWKPLPDMKTACTAWIYAGGAHHTVFSQNLTMEYFEDFSRMADIELVKIDANTSLTNFENELKWSEVYYKTIK
ncbi:L-arabinose isomerase [Sphingobacterium alkalisoli]|uniref:L-arabinose isomerase n=1 Tax=Sphingobacterium alkalisoli TaxID=1874115 RepID=A0A4U0H204_9SPHI|nr:L-arabinose isomerase [Sphingobacterium alkalisoli]TJY65615.1 L-arabinose isomerase [Sphingobacterium alkalisoli]GGH19399.1 L-arabinose isomerase [Sphingobacterium alkalisoli]